MFDDCSVDFYDAKSKRQMKYVYFNVNSPWAGWILYWHEQGSAWVSLRKATLLDLIAVGQAISSAQHENKSS